MADRLPGWEQRFEAALVEALDRPFDARLWNCAKFAHHCAQAVRGTPLPFRWHESLAGSVDALLPRVAPLLAQRGDVVMAAMPEDTLGVCCRDGALFLRPDGVARLPLAVCRLAWRV